MALRLGPYGTAIPAHFEPLITAGMPVVLSLVGLTPTSGTIDLGVAYTELMEGHAVLELGVEYRQQSSAEWTRVVVQELAAEDTLYAWTITGLLSGERYVLRAFALMDGVGRIYGDESDPVRTRSIPFLRTTMPAYVNGTTASSGGVFVDFDADDIATEKGVVVAVGHRPTVADTKFTALLGAGSLDPYTVQVTGLTLGQTYRMRAHAIDADGTNYGNEWFYKHGSGVVARPTPRDAGTGKGLGLG